MNKLLNNKTNKDSKEKIYTFEDMEILVEKIKRIKKKKPLEDIRDIILLYNPNLNITEKSSGIYLCFNKLTNTTFNKINKYIISYFESLNNSTQNISDYNIISSSANDIDYSNKYNTSDYIYDNSSRLKFSNKEKSLIKKRLYDDALKLNSHVNDYERNYKDLQEVTELKEKNDETTIFIKKVK
jgi:hypothetical protein